MFYAFTDFYVVLLM